MAEPVNPYEAALDAEPAPADPYAAALDSADADVYGAALDAEPSREQVVDQQNASLATLFKRAQLDTEVDQRAGVLKLASESGIATDVIEANYPALKGSWAAAKFDPKAWRAANPELAQLALERPQRASVIMRDGQLSAVSQLIKKIVDWADSSPRPSPEQIMAEAGGDPERAKEVQAFYDQFQDFKVKEPGKQLLVDDPEARELRDNSWTAIAGSGLILPNAAIIPFKRFLETKQQLDISKMQFELMLKRGAGADTYELEKQIIDARRQAVQRDYGEGSLGQVATDVANAAASSIEVLGDASLVGGGAAAIAGGATLLATKSPAAAGRVALKAASIGGKIGGVAGTFRLEAGDAYGELLNAKTDDGKPLDNDVATGAAVIYGGLAAGIEFISWGPMFKSMGPLGALIQKGEKKAALAAMVKDSGFRAMAKRVSKRWLASASAEGGEETLQQLTQDAANYFARSYQQGSFSSKGSVELEHGFMAGQKGFLGGGGQALVHVGTGELSNAMLRENSKIAAAQTEAIQNLVDSPTVTADPQVAAAAIEAATAKSGAPATHAQIDAPAIVKAAESLKVNPDELARQLLGERGPQALRDALETGSRFEMSMADYSKVAGSELGKKLLPDTTLGPSLLTPREIEVADAADFEIVEGTATESALREDFNDQPLEEQQARLAIDTNTGLLNERGFAAVPVNPATPYLAEFEIEAKKALNDMHGHEVLDAALRRSAQVLKDAGVVAGQAGGGLKGYTTGLEGARELAKRMDEALGGDLRVVLKTEKEAARGAGLFAHRSSPPMSHLRAGEHEIFARLEAAKAAQQEPAAADVKAAEAIVERAKGSSAELAAELKTTPAAKPVAIPESVSKGFDPAKAFEAINRTPEGLLSGEAFRHAQKLAQTGKAPKKEHTAFIDARGFGDLRPFFDDEGVDIIASDFAAAFAEVIDPPDDPARLNPRGDEFAAQTDDKARLETALAAFAKVLNRHAFFKILADGRVALQQGLYFAHEFGKDLHEADTKSIAAKKQQDRSGVVRKPRYLSADEWNEARVSLERDYRLVDVAAVARARRESGDGSKPGGSGSQASAEVAADVAQAQQSMGLLPMFRSAAEAGMTDEQWLSYLDTQEKATSHAAQAAQLRQAKDKKRRTEAWWKVEEAKHRVEAARDYEQIPARRALQFLRGKGPEAAVPVSLDRSIVEALVGDEAARRIPSREGGENPDDICDLFEFPTGGDMVRALADLPPKEQWVRDTAAARMAELHPSVLEDRAQLRELVARGLHGPYGEKWLMDELKALRARNYTLAENPEANRVQAVPNELLGKPEAAEADAERQAQNIVGRKKIERLAPGYQLQLERQAAAKAMEAAATRNYPRAYVERLKQLLNMKVYGKMLEAREQRDAFYELATELSDDKARGALFKAAPEFRDGVDLVLEALQLKAPTAHDQPLASVGDVVDVLVGDGATVMFDEDLVAGLVAKPKPYKQLTVSEMREVDTYLRNIRAAATLRTTALKEGKQIDRQQAVAALNLEAEKHRQKKGPVTSSQSAENPAQWFARGWNEFASSGFRPEMLAWWMGGRSLDSAWFKLVVEPLQKAKHLKAALMKKVVAPVAAKLEALMKDSNFMARVDGKALFPTHREDLTPPTRAYEIFMMALHAGTQSSLDRLTLGRGINEQQLVAAIDKHLSKKAVDLVQEIWDAHEALWPEAKKLEERQSGVAPPKLELRPLTTRFGTLRGGYMAAKYDARVEQVGEIQLGEALGAVMDQSYVRPGTAKNHLKKRSANFTGALLLEPGMILRVLDQVVHDIAYREPLRSVAGLIWDPKLTRTMRERLGAGGASQMRQWLRDVGNQAGAQLTDWWSQVGRAMKKRTVQAALAYRIPTALGDLSNFMIGARRIGPGAMMGGIAEVFTTKGKSIALAYEKSGELQSRRGEMLERFKADIGLMTKRGGRVRRLSEQIDRHGFTIFEWTERLFAVPAWLGAYRSVLKEKGETGAVTYADAMVRRMLPAWNPVDQSAIQRNRYLSPFLMFASWHNVMWNEMGDELEPVVQALLGGEVASASKKAAVAIPATLFLIFSSYVVGELLSGRGPEEGDGDDDAERWLRWFARKMAVGALMPAPVLGPELGGALESKVLHKRTNPRGGLYTSMISPIVDAGEKMLDGDADAEEKFFAAMKAIALILGKPQYPLTPAKYFTDLAEGDVEARGAGDVIGGGVYGQREGQPANIPTFLQGD